jgi:hypothetical protein
MVLIYIFSKDADEDMYTPEISSSLLISRGCIPDKAVVRLDEFWEVVGTRLVKINNNQDKKYKYVITFYFIYY